jgi:L,D-peptidoglycan transpeptidase YkuD (ErfK/YbiS/YcfS/YnhG family)
MSLLEEMVLGTTSGSSAKDRPGDGREPDYVISLAEQFGYVAKPRTKQRQ